MRLFYYRASSLSSPPAAGARATAAMALLHTGGTACYSDAA